MFEGDLTVLSTPELLESAAEHRAEENRRAARLIEHAQVFADRHHPDACPSRPGRRDWEGRERAVVLGGDGCPEIAEFAPAEFGLMIGISAGSAANYIGQALALRHRLPFTWARVRSGEATPWKARKIATACLELSQEAARAVDRRVAKVVDTLTPDRLDKIVEAAKKHADPEGARKKAEEKARERGVYVGRSDDHGNQTIYIRAASGHVRRFNATIASIAEALKIFGDTRNLQSRRADAVGIIADPRYTEELLLQARQQLLNTPPEPPNTTKPTASSPSPDQPTAPTAGPATDHAAGSATDHGAMPSTCEQATNRGDAAPPTADPDMDRRAATDADRATDLSPAPLVDPATNHGTAPATAWTTDGPADSDGCGRRAAEDGAHSADDDVLIDLSTPGPDDEADRDAPHPSESDLPDPLDAPCRQPVEPFDSGLRMDPEDGEPLDVAAQRALNARLAQVRQEAHTRPHAACATPYTADTREAADAAARPGATSRARGQLRPGKTEIYVHLTDHTLATGTGVLRVEDLGPLLASQLAELVGYGPYVVKPVIDLNDAVSVDAYEIPDRIRERVKLIHPVEVFPYGTRATHPAMDLDHIQPYDPLGPPGQTSTENLAPLGRFSHRVKTHGRGWNVRRLDRRTIQWSTPNGFIYNVDPTGTHRVPRPQPDA